jgi:hypothetical protein
MVQRGLYGLSLVLMKRFPGSATLSTDRPGSGTKKQSLVETPAEETISRSVHQLQTALDQGCLGAFPRCHPVADGIQRETLNNEPHQQMWTMVEGLKAPIYRRDWDGAFGDRHARMDQLEHLPSPWLSRERFSTYISGTNTFVRDANPNTDTGTDTDMPSEQ